MSILSTGGLANKQHENENKWCEYNYKDGKLELDMFDNDLIDL